MRICFIGDSLVNGTGDSACLGWTGRLCAAARQAGRDVTHYNLGVRGDTTADIDKRWYQEATRRLPTTADGRLVFSFGLNDCKLNGGRRRIPFDSSLANARSILTRARDWLPTLMVGPPPIAEDNVNKRVEVLSAEFERLCDELGIPYLPTFSALAASKAWMGETAAGDGNHPNAQGYTALAEQVADWSAWRDCVAAAPAID